jgi:hypothetical protein
MMPTEEENIGCGISVRANIQTLNIRYLNEESYVLAQ